MRTYWYSVQPSQDWFPNLGSDPTRLMNTIEHVLCGVLTESQGQWAKLCCLLISDSIIRLFYFTPRWLVGVTPCPRKSQKELYKRRQQQIGDEDVSFIFPGFNNHSMGGRVFPEYN